MTRRSKNSVERTLSDLTKRKLDRQEWGQSFTEIFFGSDRSCAILCCSFLESTLSSAIRCIFENSDPDTLKILHSREGPLSTFFSQIHLSYAAGLFDLATRTELDLIRRIRNVFAHSFYPVDFSTPEISRACALLQGSSDKSVLKKIEKELPQMDFLKNESKEISEAKLKYIKANYSLAIHLTIASKNFLKKRIREKKAQVRSLREKNKRKEKTFRKLKKEGKIYKSYTRQMKQRIADLREEAELLKELAAKLGIPDPGEVPSGA